MKKHNKVFFVTFLIGLLCVFNQRAYENQTNAHSIKLELPQDLMFEGKPIDPRIMSQLGFGDSTRFEPINIKDWLNMTAQTINLDEPKNGSFGGEIQDPLENSYSCEWKYIGTINDNHIIEVHERGITSNISTIFLMSRNGDTVQNVGDFTGGYGSHWTIVDAFLNDDILSIGQIITQREMFLECLEILAEDIYSGLQVNKDQDYAIIKSIEYRGKIIPVDDLYSINADWAGTILTAWNNTASRDVIGFELYESYTIDARYEENSEQPLLQKCFDVVYKSYLQNQETLDSKHDGSSNTKILNNSEMAQFAKDVLDLYFSFNPTPIENPKPEAITKNLLPGVSSFAYLTIVELAKEQEEKNN